MNNLNKSKEIIEALEKNYNVNVQQIAKDYSDMKTLEQMAEIHNTNVYTIYTVLRTLGLRTKKKHRALDYGVLQAQLLEGSGVKEDVIDKMFGTEQEISQLRHELKLKNNALLKLRTESNQLRYELRNEVKAESVEERLTKAFEKGLLNKQEQVLNLSVKLSNAHLQDVPEDGLVVLYGDIHLGEVVSKNEVPNNEYNYKIAKLRMNHYIDEILTYNQQSNNIVVVNLNDNLKGIIHGGLYTSEGSFIQSLLELVELNAYFYSVLAAVYDSVKVVSTGDNHSRVTDYVAVNNKNIDYARLTTEMTKSLLKAKGINNVVIEQTDHDLCMFEVNGAQCVAFHGDTLRSYSVSSDIQRAKLQDKCLAYYGKTYKHAFNGHQHVAQLSTNQYGGMSIQNGTLVGSNTYGTTSGFSNVSATQVLCFVNKQSNIEDIKVVNFDHVRGE